MFDKRRVYTLHNNFGLINHISNLFNASPGQQMGLFKQTIIA